MIQIVDYQPTWPDEFRQLAGALRESLGPRAHRVDHIGSTSVPNLPAKNILDIQLTVPALDPSLIAPLSQLGFTHLPHIAADHVPPGSPARLDQWTKWFFKATPPHRATNLHLRLPGRPNQRYALLFRDYLRSDPAAAEAYAQIKFALARLHPNDIDAYYAIKDPACDLIMRSAEQWAARTNWIQGPSDS
jgi:GrpB-like predicted nucleotidyltransferase (UPF0157 family)